MHGGKGKGVRISYDLWLIFDRLDTWRKCVQMHWVKGRRERERRPAGTTGCFVIHFTRFFRLSVFLFIHKWMHLGCFFVRMCLDGGTALSLSMRRTSTLKRNRVPFHPWLLQQSTRCISCSNCGLLLIFYSALWADCQWFYSTNCDAARSEREREREKEKEIHYYSTADSDAPTDRMRHPQWLNSHLSLSLPLPLSLFLCPCRLGPNGLCMPWIHPTHSFMYASIEWIAWRVR